MTPFTKGKYIFGTVKVGERGQIVIPKEARELFDIKAGDLLLIVGNEARGIGIVKAEVMEKFALEVLEGTGHISRRNKRR